MTNLFLYEYGVVDASMNREAHDGRYVYLPDPRIRYTESNMFIEITKTTDGIDYYIRYHEDRRFNKDKVVFEHVPMTDEIAQLISSLENLTIESDIEIAIDLFNRAMKFGAMIAQLGELMYSDFIKNVAMTKLFPNSKSAKIDC